jgi:hypothetical protein
VVAQLDDRDVAQWLGSMELDGGPVSDEALMAWLDGGAGELVVNYRGQRVPVQRIGSAELSKRFGYIQTPTQPT